MGRTLILSDIHFCKRGSSIHCPEQLRPLWQGFDAVIFNGDTAEMHSASHAKRSKQMARLLLETAIVDNVEATLICGNHDPTLSDHDYVWLCNKNILVFHGHASFKGVVPWSWRCKHIAKYRQEVLQQTGDGFDEQLAALRTASDLSATGAFSHLEPSIPKKLLFGIPAAWNVLYGWWKFPSLTALWVSQYAPSAKFIITGHTHHAGIWKRNNLVIINTGFYGFPSHPYAVVVDDHHVFLHRVRKHHGNYSLGRVCKSWSAL